jgi:hypothetical protein
MKINVDVLAVLWHCLSMNDDSIQSMGGKARAESLTDEQRKTIATKAAQARWGYPKTGWEGDLTIGTVTFRCAVVLGQDGKPIRVVSETAFMEAMGMYRSGALSVRREQLEGGAQVPLFLAYKNLQPFILKHLGAVHYQPMKVIYKSGNVGLGIPADIIPKICEIWIDANKAGVLGKRQRNVADLAEVLIRGFAKIGIIALVDEATGYQKERAQKALAEILEQFIAKELRAWTKTFPLEFYEQIFRLKAWPFDPGGVKRPSVIGHYTNNIVYRRLAPGVLEELRKNNPVIDGRRKHKHFQWLTGDIGDPKLRSHIDGVLALMRVSDSWEQFKKFLNKAFPIIETTDLGFDIEIVEHEKPQRLV